MHKCYSNHAYMHRYCSSCIWYFTFFFSLLDLTLTSLSFYLGPLVHRLVQPLSLMVCFPYVLIFFIFCEANGYRVYKCSPSLSDRQYCGFGGLFSFSLSIESVAWFCSMEIGNAMEVGLVWVFCVVGLWWCWFTGSMISFFWWWWCVVQRWWSGVTGVSFFVLIFYCGYCG